MKKSEEPKTPKTYVAFYQDQLVARGSLRPVLTGIKAVRDSYSVLVFDESDGRQVDFDLRGTVDEICRRMDIAPAAVGRPRLGIIAREVTLLPRHWSWLESQPKGASAALRDLVEAAMRQSERTSPKPNVDAIYRIMSVTAGNLSGFEEAARALYKSEWDHFRDLVAAWPHDLRDYFDARLLDGKIPFQTPTVSI